MILSNTGESGSVLDYSVSKSYPDLDSPFEIPGGGPDSYGYFWSDSDINSEINYNWVDISDNMNQVTFTANDIATAPINIGFNFPFYGEEYSDFIINPNGWIGFEDDNTEWHNGNIPSEDYPKSAIFGFWDDLNPINDGCNDLCAGNVYYQSNSDRLVVWFNNVYHWSSDEYVNTSWVFVANEGNLDENNGSFFSLFSYVFQVRIICRQYKLGT